MIRSLSSFLIGVVAFAAAVIAAPASIAAPPACGINLGAQQVIDAVKSLPPYPGPDRSWPWSSEPASFEGNFNPCSTLSTALVTVQGATGSSPMTALMFHDGNYLGTATSKAYSFTTLDEGRTSDDTVVLDYKDGRDVCTACAGPVSAVRYQWQGDHVAMLDPAPPS